MEEKVKAYKELARQITELEAQKKALGAEILQLMPKTTKTIEVAGYQVKRYTRLSIKTSLETARLIDAIKTEEVVDKDRIKELLAAGHSVPDVTSAEYVIITRATRKS